MKYRMALVCVVFAALVLGGCASEQELAFQEVALKNHSALTPGVQTATWAVQWWGPRHDAVVKRVKEGNVDLLMIGDSITHGWESGGKEYWDKYYAPRNAVNMGFSGDRTQHVLWRLANGEIDGINPKLAVIMIGTNNSNGHDNTAEEIADGIVAICAKLRAELPEMKILILTIFPRAPEPCDQRVKNSTASQLASRIADDRTIFYLDINDEFLDDDQKLPKEIMPDYLHPNTEGYRIWAEAMEDKIAELMAE